MPSLAASTAPIMPPPPPPLTLTQCPAEEDDLPVPLRLRLPDGREIAIDRSLRVGSSADAEVRIADPYVSACHCVIAPDERGRTLIHDRSTNGTFLGGCRVRGGELRPGAQITVGQTVLRILAASSDQSGGAGGGDMVGKSPALTEMRRRIERVAPSKIAVLIAGESGTGKELAARAIHAASGRRGRFVAINCGAISPSLVESELFGHEKGAFTGAQARKAGVFEEADGGTLFLDEIGELPLSLQPKLLRALEQQVVRPVGGSGERAVDVRVVAATHRDLLRLVEVGAFRLDLYHRLANFAVCVPPLRERKSDIPLLARRFLDEIALDQGPRQLSKEALAALCENPWPGNIRELKNALFHAAIMSGGRVILREDLPPVTLPATLAACEPAPPPYGLPSSSASSTAAPAPASPSTPPGRLDALERETIVATLRALGTTRKAAAALGIPKSTLYDNIHRYGLRPRN